jgi:hypothetical protein
MTGYQSKKAAAQAKLTVNREQLEQWLEALKDIDALHHPAEPESADAQKAIAEMEKVLAQPAQQEPAFWLNEQGQLKATRGDAERHSIGQKIISLYTAPPQRPWVDLTEEEIENCYGGAANDFARAVLAKLKERNT